MKTHFEFIYFELIPSKQKKKDWVCKTCASKVVLGTVLYWSPWRKYVFDPERLSCPIFSPGCLRDVALFTESVQNIAKGEAATMIAIDEFQHFKKD